jgi:hypothetical protein
MQSTGVMLRRLRSGKAGPDRRSLPMFQGTERSNQWEESMAGMLPLFGAALAGMVIGAVGVTHISGQNVPQITRTEILRQPMSGIKGKEVVVFTADVPPGGVADRHYHPGDEAIYTNPRIV